MPDKGYLVPERLADGWLMDSLVSIASPSEDTVIEGVREDVHDLMLAEHPAGAWRFQPKVEEQIAHVAQTVAVRGVQLVSLLD
ncbi:hypothetical protein IT575_09060 [bacterium]|nr:hypothetical protein [bacterium]